MSITNERESGELESTKLSAWAERAVKGQDKILFNDTLGLYGVFDGVGGSEGDSALAAEVARDTIETFLASAKPETGEDLWRCLRDAFLIARGMVVDKGKGGETAASVAWLRELEDGHHLAVGHAGDARIYLKRQGTVTKLTEDQGSGHKIYNYFSNSPPGFFYFYDKFELHAVRPGDRVMLCTDGITGNTENDSLSAEEIAYSLSEDKPDSAAKKLLKISRKVSDDASVIVIDV